MPNEVAPSPTGIVSITVFILVSITEIVLLRPFVTYMAPLYGLNATFTGPFPTGIVSITVFVLVSITEVLLLMLLSTYIFPLYGLKAISTGLVPTGILDNTTACGKIVNFDASLTEPQAKLHAISPSAIRA